MTDNTTSMIENVARALWFDHVDQHGYPNGLPTWEELLANPQIDQGRLVEEFRSYARAAIAAMREPTEAMVQIAGEKTTYNTETEMAEQIGAYIAHTCWQAMIDAALSDATTDKEAG